MRQDRIQSFVAAFARAHTRTLTRQLMRRAVEIQAFGALVSVGDRPFFFTDVLAFLSLAFAQAFHKGWARARARASRGRRASLVAHVAGGGRQTRVARRAQLLQVQRVRRASAARGDESHRV